MESEAPGYSTPGCPFHTRIMFTRQQEDIIVKLLRRTVEV